MPKLSRHVPMIVACLATSLSSLLAQEHDPIGRSNPNVGPLEAIAVQAVPPLDRHAIAAEDAINDRPGVVPRFAIPNMVDITPWTGGTWEAANPVMSLWRLRVHCPGASHVNLGFDRFKLPADSQLMVYASDYSYIVRPFTGRDHNPDLQLWTPLVHGEEIVVELYVPTALRPNVQLHLMQISSGYRFFGAGRSALEGDGSGACNVNVVCPQGNNWRPEIATVQAMIIGGTGLCTGCLINNTSNDSRPLFLTADHCGIDSTNASTVVVYFNYEEPTCAASGMGSQAQFVTGTTFRADNAPSDMTLLELNSRPMAGWNASLAGWDRSGADATSAVAIHHPAGDAKKISFENDPTTTTSYSSSTVPGDGTHIRVADWDLGTTEGGSSGSPLFDQNKRVIGQLHGGGAACGNNASDWYGKLSVSWTGGGTNSTRLSNWLDPTGTGAMTTNTIGFGGMTGLPNDDCAGAIAVADGTNGPYSSSNATTSTPAWPCAQGGNDVWFSYAATCTGMATFATCSATLTFDSAIEVFRGTCGSLTSLGCDDDGCGVGGGGSSIMVNTTAGTTYYVRVGGFQGATGMFDLTINCTGTMGLNDECVSAIAVTGGVNGPFSNANATTSAPAWGCAQGGNDLWFRYTAPRSGSVTFDTCSMTRNFDTGIEAFSGNCANLSSIGCNDDGGACSATFGSSLTIMATMGTTYYVRVGGYQGATGNFDLTVTGGTGGMFNRTATGCGGLTITEGGTPNIGNSINFAIGGPGAGTSVILYGFRSGSLPLCPPAPCALLGRVSGSIMGPNASLSISNRPTTIGVSAYFQGITIAPGGCNLFGFLNITMTDTIQVVIGQ